VSLDEVSVVMKARELVRLVNPATFPVEVESYARQIGATVRLETDLGEDEPGWSCEIKGKRYICVNAKERIERQRFTICHEVAHKVLGLPSDHQGSSTWSYAKKSPAEIFCDIFAAELLLPYRLFKPLADQAAIGLAAIDALAGRFLASGMATGSRFAAVVNAPCAYVISEQGKVRYASRSKALREANAWIPPRVEMPQRSLSIRLRGGAAGNGAEQIEADEWFQHWERGGVLLEEARHLDQWDQTLTLLWFEDEEVPPENSRAWENRGQSQEEAELLPELDGVLRWPGKRRRR
jgi:hypothetical protein